MFTRHEGFVGVKFPLSRPFRRNENTYIYWTKSMILGMIIEDT